MIYLVTASVRRLGAIWVNYSHDFTVTSEQPLNIEGIRDAWFSQYGDQWELFHLIATREVTP